MSLLKQYGNKDRAYTIWVQLEDGKWVLKREPEIKTKTETYQTITCVKNCNSDAGNTEGLKPEYEIKINNKATSYLVEGRTVEITIGAGQLENLFNLQKLKSYFPPITSSINCKDYAPLNFKGGQESEDYIITMKAKGVVIDSLTKETITTFNSIKSIECPGPIAGFAINQYAKPILGRRDLSIHGYYFDSLQGNQIISVDKPFNLSLKEATGDMTIDGNQFEFLLTSSELVSIKRKDGVIETTNDTTIGPPVCRVIIKDAIGLLLDVVVFGNPTINIQDPWGNIKQQN